MIGFLNINKPENMTSAQVVAKVKHSTHEKVGHLGTLDPLAKGVLPIAIGKATRLFDFFLNKDKVYVAKAQFGVLTDTLDLAGKIIATNKILPTKEQILAILPNFIGKIAQIPPMFSAKNVNGARAYDLARQGISVHLEPKLIEIYDLKLLSFNGTEAEFEIHCSAGTYVRSLMRDLAEALGTIATTTSIFRTKSGIFEISSSHTIEDLQAGVEDKIIPLNQVLKDLPYIVLTDEQKQRLLNGLEVIVNVSNTEQVVLKTQSQEIYGLAQIINGKIILKTFLLEN